MGTYGRPKGKKLLQLWRFKTNWCENCEEWGYPRVNDAKLAKKVGWK